MYTNFYASVVMVALLSMQATPINLNNSDDQAVFEPEQANTFAEINSAIMSYDGTAQEFFIDNLAQVGFEEGEDYLAQIEDTMSPDEFDMMLINPLTYSVLAQLTEEELGEMRANLAEADVETEGEDEMETHAQVQADADALAAIEATFEDFDGTAEEYFIEHLAAVGVEEGEEYLAQIEATMSPTEFDEMLVNPVTYHNMAQLSEAQLMEIEVQLAETRTNVETESEDEEDTHAQVEADADALAAIEATFEDFDGTAEEYFIAQMAAVGVEEGEDYLAQIEATMSPTEFDEMLVNPVTYHNLAQMTPADLMEMEVHFAETLTDYVNDEEETSEVHAQADADADANADANALATIEAALEDFDGTAQEFFIERLAQAGVEEGEVYLTQIQGTMDSEDFDQMLVNPMTYHNLAQMTPADLMEMEVYFAEQALE